MSWSRETNPSEVTVLELFDQPSPRKRLLAASLVLTLLVMNAVAAIFTLVTEVVNALTLSELQMNTLLPSLL